MLNTKTAPCLVIGASGFTGLNLVRKMAESGMYVRAMSRTGKPIFEHANVVWIAGDFLDSNSLDSALYGCSSCVQLAITNKMNSLNSDLSCDITSNVIGNVHLLEKLAKRPGIKFIYTSSGGTVYGNPIHIPIKESHPTDPISSYGITKLAVEKYISLFSYVHGLDATVLRVANPFGEHQSYSNGQGVISTLLWKIFNKQPIEIWGNGTTVRDYLYIGDVCDAIITALDYHGKSKVINVGSGQGLSLIEIISGIEKVTGMSAEVTFKPSRPTDVQISILDNSLAKSELGWAPNTSFADALERTFKGMTSRGLRP